MELNRRDFVLLAAAACAGCSSGGSNDPSAPLTLRTVDAGPASLYASDGIYDHFRHQGFFLVKKNGTLTALSSGCTHRDCPLRALPDHTFSCRCHGSRFDDGGTVLKGPAVRSLPQFPTSVNESQHLLVQVSRGKFDEE